MDNLPQGLINAVRENNLVIFAGAGLSYNFKNTNDIKLQGWKNLVTEMLNFLEPKDPQYLYLNRLEKYIF